MSKVAASERLDELMEGRIDRRNLEELLQHIYASFKSVDQAGSRIRQLREQVDGASGAERRDLEEKLGILLYAMGKYREAIRTLEAAKARKEAAHFLGRSYLELGDTGAAIAFLEKGRDGTEDFHSDMLIAEAYCRERTYEKAEKLCKKYLDSHGDCPDLLYVLGRVAEVKGEYEAAMEYFEKALERDPQHRQALFRLAYNCDLNGNDERAMELYGRCASVQPTCVGALINLGVLYEDYGLYNEAIGCYRRVLALDPAHQRAGQFLRDAESSLAMQLDEDSARRMHRVGGQLLMTQAPDAQVEGQGGAPAPQQDADEKLSIPIDDLDLSTRSRRCMEKLQIRTVGELITHTEHELLKSPNFGRKSIAEIRNKLAALGLDLRSE